ncbi:sensor histidine kinase [Paradesertivirga mongoliensis]|uniref:histidine kinase n=1 Tax=Paradesertivirga mongoliensis TaxID=2100740 RepID=A0ABW4ZJZ7_9SPHI|nr:HAMP domain-containing sensor histidine kinase [Pedobacter mongoliensis]
MLELITLTLENEMDLVLAQKKASKLSEILKLSLSTQATFVTAIAELCRVVIDFTDTGVLSLGLVQKSNRYSLSGIIQYDSVKGSTISDESFFYAKKLVPLFQNYELADKVIIEIGINLPRSISLDQVKIKFLKDYFDTEPPISAYEEVKRKNLELFLIAETKDAQLRQSKYIDEKRNEFISIASHELKTPITIIKAYTQLALMGKEACSEQVRDFLLKIDAQSTKLRNLVQQLLDTSKIENGRLEYNYEEVDFNSFIQEASFLLTHLLPKHELTVELGASVMVKLDRERMDQVFTNLISNAGKYSRAGSKVVLRTAICKKGNLTVSVADEGIGMSEESIEKIFQKFHRDKQVVNGYSGLGMGLYIASEIINDHGGKIWVESTKDVGSTFFFSLPGMGVC